ncbi:MAG: nucleotidyltransferase family protein [Pseudomonadota bacterium]
MTPPVMIFAAGRGERLRPLTDSTPKPLVPVAGIPLLERQLTLLAAGGVRHVVINLHHLGEQIEAHIGDGARFGLRVRYSREAQKLETGGGLLQALPLLGKGPIWLLNGDVVMTPDLARFPQRLTPGSDMHLLLTPTPAARDRGDFTFDGTRVTGWGDSHVYCGLALLEGAFFRRFARTLLAQRQRSDVAGEPAGSFSLRTLFEHLVDRQRLHGSLYEGPWIDIGSPAQLKAANALLADTPP